MNRFTALVMILGVLVSGVSRAGAEDSIADTFATPPVSAKPSIWWYWGESVTTKHGITQDLESLKRVGFGGVVVYEQVFTDRPDAWKSLSPEWLEHWRFAAAECARLGMKLEVNVSNGFVAGGPWITPELGMQRLVASEVVIEGGRAVSLRLPQPKTKFDTYKEVAVLAYPAPAGAEGLPKPSLEVRPTVAQIERLLGADQAGKVRISPPKDGSPVLVQLDYGEAVTVRSISYTLRSGSKALVIATQMPGSWADDFHGQNMHLNPPIGTLEASADGTTWRSLCTLPMIGYQHDTWDQQTLAFPATTARYFRLNLKGWGHNGPAKDDDLLIGNLELRGDARVDHWESKSGNVVDFSNPDRTPDYAGDELIDPERIIDLSDKLGPDGLLTWQAPPGRWSVLRLGHTPTGGKTKHGRPEGMGLECDKLNPEAVRVQFDHYVGRLLKEVRAVPGAKLAGVNIDSNEHGSQNWTGAFLTEFKQRRGYELRRLLPAMMGRVVGSREQSDKLLFDVRRTIADLMSDAYFGTFTKLCHAEGMTTMAQAPGIATCLPSDNIQAKGRTDIPMGEFWMSQRDGTIDCKETASAAHVYGLPVAAAESFTGSMDDAHPAMMKPFANAALALGINRFVVLAYVHQPRDNPKPGISQDRFFVPFNRNNTWWEDSAGFWNSLARSSQLMRQGLPVCDLLYHLGNDTPLKIATSRLRPAPPSGHDYDVCGDEILLTRTTAVDGRIVLPDGMSYRMLVLAGGPRLTLAAARKIRELVHEGALVLGPTKPIGSPSLADGPEGDAEVRRIADELWGEGSQSAVGEKRTGAGIVIWGRSPGETLASCGVGSDFTVSGAKNDAGVLYAHRRTREREIYFVANHRHTAQKIEALFRVAGRTPERWDPETGLISPLADWHSTNGTTHVPLALEAYASAFIVFRSSNAASAAPLHGAQQTLVKDMPELLSLNGPWQLRFMPDRGAPDQIVVSKLQSLPEFAEAGVRHYSGTMWYSQDFDAGALAPGQKTVLDLGEVAVLAAVKLNGQDLGVAWRAPYSFDVSKALRPGKNQLEVRVVNLWTNRLIADGGLPEAERKTWVTWNPHKPGEALRKSGLLGPVLLRRAP